MPKYYVSAHLTREASSVYELHDDGSYRSISPQGQEHRGSGAIPASLEIEPEEALQLIAERNASMKDHEEVGSPSWGPVDLSMEGLLNGVITDEQRARDEWRNNGWGTGEPNDPPRLPERLSQLLRALRRRSD
jgi:hypothetical protein